MPCKSLWRSNWWSCILWNSENAYNWEITWQMVKSYITRVTILYIYRICRIIYVKVCLAPENEKKSTRFSLTMRLSKILRSSWKIDLVADDLEKGHYVWTYSVMSGLLLRTKLGDFRTDAKFRRVSNSSYFSMGRLPGKLPKILIDRGATGLFYET